MAAADQFRSSSTRDVGTSTINKDFASVDVLLERLQRVFGTDIATRLAAQAPKTAPMAVPIKHRDKLQRDSVGGVK